MKEEKPKLVLNKRTIARLNNLQMRNVRGGDGDEGGISRNTNCGDTDSATSKPDVVDLARSILSFLIKVC